MSETEASIRLNFFISHQDSLGNLDTNEISDGYHTFGELYDFRMALVNALFRKIFAHAHRVRIPEARYRKFEDCQSSWNPIWKSKLHSDRTMFDEFFIIGCFSQSGEQISFHFPIATWDIFNYAREIEQAPEWDGHTSADVLKRLKNL